MIRIAGGTHFLVLHAEADGHIVHSFRRFDEAVARFNGSSRLSPIFPVADAPPPPVSDQATSYLLFIGPFWPGDIDPPDGVLSYITQGLLNLVFFARSLEMIEKIRFLAEQRSAGWELWTIAGNRIMSIRYSHPGTVDLPDAVTKPLAITAKPMIPTGREFHGVIANAVGRAQLYKEPIEQDLLRFSQTVRDLIANDKVHEVERLQYLITSNVAVARLTWQLFGGSSPIVQNPLQLATHSLLGLGTAARALRVVARFVEHVFETVRIRDRLRSLERSAATGKRLVGLAATDSFWEQDFLYLHDDALLPAAGTTDLPQLTSFSGRDGFRSTGITLSAPIEVITGCNTPSWTLQTLTHEMSHSRIRAVLGLMLPKLDNENIKSGSVATSEYDELWALVRKKPDSAPNAFVEARVFLLDAIRLLKSEKEIEHFTKEQYFSALKTNIKEADEILTHVFDFLYFYRGSEPSYIRAVWASWATIPHIQDRVREYIIRTLCALYANSLRRDDGTELTIAVLESALIQLQGDFPDSLYIPEAVLELQSNKQKYLSALRSRTPLVKFVRYFLWSSRIARLLNENADTASALKAGIFGDEKVQNPLAFLGEWSVDKSPDPLRAAWMLQVLAYGVLP